MRHYTAHCDPGKGYCAIIHGIDFSMQVSYWYKTLARLNRYWGVKNGIRFKSVKDVVYK